MPLVHVKRVEETHKLGIFGHSHDLGGLLELVGVEIVVVCQVHVIDVDLLELIKVNVARILLAVAIYEALRLNALPLQCRCLVDLVCDCLTEVLHQVLHGGVEVARFHRGLCLLTDISLAEELIVGEGIVCSHCFLTRLHLLGIKASHSKNLVEGLGCLAMGLKVVHKSRIIRHHLILLHLVSHQLPSLFHLSCLLKLLICLALHDGGDCDRLGIHAHVIVAKRSHPFQLIRPVVDIWIPALAREESLFEVLHGDEGPFKCGLVSIFQILGILLEDKLDLIAREARGSAVADHNLAEIIKADFAQSVRPRNAHL